MKVMAAILAQVRLARMAGAICIGVDQAQAINSATSGCSAASP